MPELPEVETIRKYLIKKKILGSQVEKIKFKSGRVVKVFSIIIKTFSQTILKDKIVLLERRGKYLFLVLEKTSIIFHFGMSGIFHWDDSLPNRKHQYLVLELSNGFLSFTDPRTFGKIIPYIFMPNKNKKIKPKIKLAELLVFFNTITQLGPDLLLDSIGTIIKSCMEKKSQRKIKSYLLDQRILAGVGNIYADEALFQTCIHPQTKVFNINQQIWKKLIVAIKKIMEKAIQSSGTTLVNFHLPDGMEGAYQYEFQVYGRSGLPCKVCETTLIKIILQGRSAVYCGRCQPMPRP